MSEVTRILSAISRDDRQAAEQLLPLVYDELRNLAAQKLAYESPGQTLTPTALVHEAYLRLVDREQSARWDSRAHFFGAAAEAMRRILVEAARRKQSAKHGGELKREDLHIAQIAVAEIPEDLLALDDALKKLEGVDSAAAAVVNLRYFAGLSGKDVADILGVSERTADRAWAFARAWLHKELRSDSPC